MMLRICLLLALGCFLSTSGSHVEDDCDGKIELGLLIDVSVSYGKGGEWLKVQRFWRGFLDYYRIDAKKTRLGVITYAKQPKLLFNFEEKKYQSLEAAKIAIVKALKDIKPGGKALIEKALLAAHDVFFNLPPRNNTQRVLFVFSGGKSKTPDEHFYEDIIRSIEEQGVNKVAVSWTEKEAFNIVGRRGHAVFVKDISDALSKLQEIVKYTCIVNGGYAEWNEWGVCSKTCGGGSQTRHRTCSNPVPSDNGKNCDNLGPSAAERPCNSQRCGDIDGGYSEWTAWSGCSHTCGIGRKKRHRLCVNPPQQDNGKFCNILGPAMETRKCNEKKCKGDNVQTDLRPVPESANIKPCEQGLDLAIVIDASLSIPTENLESLLKTFFAPYITTFRISQTKTHFGLIRFHRTSHLDFNFAEQSFHSPEKLTNQITNTEPVTIFKTRIDRALLTARLELFTARAGDRKNHQNVMLLFTDGKPFPPEKNLPFNETIPPLREEKKVHIVAVGYGPKEEINRTVLEEIGGDNVVIMHLKNDSGYESYASQIRNMVCNVDGGYTQWSFWSICSVYCGAGTQTRDRNCTAPPKRKGGKDCKGDFVEVRACGEVYCPIAPSNCKDVKLDLAIVIEASTELGMQHFLSAKDFIYRLLQLYDISFTGTHISLVLFNKMAHSVISFDQSYFQNIDSLTYVLQYLPPILQSGHRLDEALKYIKDFVFSTSRGDRPDVKDVAVFLTDGLGVSVNDISQTVSSLRDKKVNMATVSFGTEIREEVLYEIAGSKMCLSSSANAMVAKVEHVASIICDIK